MHKLEKTFNGKIEGTKILISEDCTECKGAGNSKHFDHKVDCGYCNGSGRIIIQADIDTLITLLKESPVFETLFEI